MTEKIWLNDGWEFTEAWTEEFGRGAPCPAAASVRLPHTCRETPYDYFDESIYQMVCGYRRRLSVPADWAGKRVFLTLGAAGHRAEIYADGKRLSEHRCGYTAFTTELTDALTPGEETVLSVRVDSRESLDQPPFGHVIDYMTYGGLYREAWLEVRGPAYIADVFLMPEADPETGGGTLRSQVEVAGAPAGYTIRQTVFTCYETAEEPYLAAEDRIVASGEAEGQPPELKLDRVGLWDIDSPVRYQVKTELVVNGQTADEVVTRVGFRRAEFRADGFYLNGRRVKLTGLNRHQSWPYIGYAAPASLQRLDADILKNELGLNAVRTSHYPQSHHFIDRCDELGLLVFTEIPGWQHIGGDAWKDQAVKNTEDMVRQYRNHPSIVLWGVRINESHDDDELYRRTNAAAHALDPTRPTGGVRYLKKSSFLEDVYTYNDFSHDGKAPGCEPKKNVTPDVSRPYLISEYNGHMFPCKTFDPEEHRLEHALRHAAVLDAAAAQPDIAGTFGWCMFDYNTHRDFGSGDRICYHGVTDMFRNKKPAADVYAVRQDGAPVLSVSSTMDIGEHPAGNRGRLFLFTNGDEVRFYKGDALIRTYTHRDSPYKNLARPPIEVDDLVGDLLEAEGFAPAQARMVKDLLNHTARFGSGRLPLSLAAKAAWLMLRYRMSFGDAYDLYQKYIGNWGGDAGEYRFEAVKDGTVVKTVRKAPMTEVSLTARPSRTRLREGTTWDAALIRLAAVDQNGNVLPFYNGPVDLETEGPVEVIGPKRAMLRGGLGGTLVRTTGDTGPAALTLTLEGHAPVRLALTVEREEA